VFAYQSLFCITDVIRTSQHSGTMHQMMPLPPIIQIAFKILCCTTGVLCHLAKPHWPFGLDSFNRRWST